VIEPHELVRSAQTDQRPTTRAAADAGPADDPPANPPIGSGASWLSPGRTAGLPLDAGSRFLIGAADLQIVVVNLQGQWWAVQGELPADGAGQADRDVAGCWRLQPGVPVVFGRETPGNFRYPPSPLVSRRHVALTLLDDGTTLSVEDMNSTNGTEILAG
jgi:hypothetical protein